MSRIRISRNQLQVAIDLCQSGNSPASRLNLKILLLLTHIPPLALHRVARRVSCSLNHVRHVVGWVNAKDFQKLTRPGAFRKTRLLTRGQERQLARKLRNKLESAREVVTWSGNRLSVPAAYAWSKRLGHSFRRARAARRAALSSARKQGRQKAQRIKLPPEEIERLKQRLSFERQRMGLGDDEFRVYGPTHKPIRDDNPVLRLETIIRLGGSSDSVSDICTLLKCYPADVRRCQKRYIAVKGDLDAFCTPKRNGRPRKNAAPDSIGEVKVETDPSRAPAPCGAPAQGRDANLWLSLKSHDLARALLDRDLAGAGNPGTHALVFLQGVRGSGKTTLAKQLKNAAYFDCEAPETLQGLQAPLGFLRRPNEPIVIVDEIGLLQNRQEFFQAVLEVSKTKQILAISSSSKALEVSPALKWRVIGDRAEPIVEWDAESEPLGYCHIKLLPLIAFAVPFALLYFLNPMDPYLKLSAQDSFQLMWKGRTFQLFFIWLVALEYILSWESIKLKISKENKVRALFFGLVLLLPTLYVLFENYFGLNAGLANWAMQSGGTFSDSMPLAIEYLAFSLLFCVTIFFSFGKKGLAGFALPALFVGLVGALYTIDNFFPYGQFTPFQLLVPTTASLAAGILGLMGNTVLFGTELGTGMPTLDVSGPLGTAKFAIAWPCAGIESLLIFTAVALLFLKRMTISWKTKIGYFAFGAAITYFINVLRIATIFTIGMQYGVNSSQVQAFHFYYGPLYAMAWIVSFSLIILLSQGMWRKIKVRKPQLTQLNPA